MPARVKMRRVSKKAKRPIWTDADRAAAWSWISEQLKNGIKPEVTRMSLVDWAELRRVIPQGLSSMPGRFSWSVTPYLVEPAECLSETSPVKEVAVIKGAQVGFTVGILENWMLYTIDQAPGPMLYVAQSQQAAEKNMNERIKPAIVQSGLEHKIFAQSKIKGSKQSGNTDDSLQFPGGRLHAIGPNMGSRARSDSHQKGAFDELDAWQQEIGSATGKRKSEGSTLQILRRRFDTFETTMKICYGSTPLVKGSSLIEPLYLMGDQRQYNVPCKHCGELQPLEWENLKFTVDDSGRLDVGSVHYECRACKGHWKNSDKVEFLKGERDGGLARWIPTAEPRRPGMRSYHIPSMLSPVGFRSWEDMAQEFVEAGKDPTLLQTFWNTSLGRTWTVTGTRVDYTRIMMRREHEPDVYREWPMGALFVTIGADVQGGNHPRIEAEVVAWGRNKESWSLGYHVFHGDTTDLASNAWTGLADLIMREHCGKESAITLVDSGFESSVVYAFCESMAGKAGMVLPSKGESAQSQTKRLFALREVTGYGVRRVDIQTNQLKSELYKNLRREWPEQGLCPPGYCHFPGEYTNSYFEGLTAEEVQWKEMPNGGKIPVWRKIPGRGRNEPHDCRIYAMAALYVLRGQILTELGLDDELVTWEQFWDILDAA